MYRVGYQCVGSLEYANDIVLSQVQPLILPDGSYIRPYKVGSDWYLGQEKIVLSYPECSLSEQFAVGSLVGFSIFLLFLIMFFFKILRKMIYSGGGANGD